MSMHRLTSITVGVPDVQETVEYKDYRPISADGESVSAYSPEGLIQAKEHWFSTVDGGEQLRIVESPCGRLIQVGIGVKDLDDLESISPKLHRLDRAVKCDETSVTSEDPSSEVKVMVEIAPKIAQEPIPWPVTNGPSRTDRIHERAPKVLREHALHPRKLGHVVIGPTDQEASTKFLTDGLGLRSTTRCRSWPRPCAARQTTQHPCAAGTRLLPEPRLMAGRRHRRDRPRGHGDARERPDRHVWGWASISSARTTSGIYASRPATSPSTAATSIASSTTSCGPPEYGRETWASTPSAPSARSAPSTAPRRQSSCAETIVLTARCSSCWGRWEYHAGCWGAALGRALIVRSLGPAARSSKTRSRVPRHRES